MLSTNKKRLASLKRYLDRLYKTFDISYLSTDPLSFVHGFKRNKDQEIVGLIASSLAYGRVEGIKRSVEKVLGVIGQNPYAFTMNFSPRRDRGKFGDFVHRFSRGRDICCLIYFARQMIEESGSIGRFFLKGYSSDDQTVKEALVRFSDAALSLDSAAVYGKGGLPGNAGVRFFFPSPVGGSPCKRLNLYLRWMVRRADRLDFGIWKEVDPAKLVIPLDTHIARISRNIGITARVTADWKMAEEITSVLRTLDPKDPVKYDFSLCRLGILDKCPSRRDLKRCESCLIKKVCVL